MKRGTLRGLLLASLIRAFSLAGCSDGGRTDDGRTVYAFAERDTIALSELFGSRGVRRVRLQAPDSVPAAAEGSILRLAGGRPVVCEPFGAGQGVWLFGEDGRYIGPVGRVGRGPGEYVVPMNALVSPGADTLYVLDGATRRILTYSLPERTFCGDRPWPFDALFTHIDRAGNFVWYVSAAGRNAERFETLVVTRPDGTLLGQATPVEQLDRYSGAWQGLTLFHDAPGGVMAHHQFQPEFFSVPGGEPRIGELRFENHAFAPASYAWDRADFREAWRKSPFVQYYDLLETADRMYVRFGAGEKRYFGVYDKSRGGGVYCEASRIGDDLGLGGVPWMSGVDGDRFFGRTTDPETMASEVVWL